MVPFGSFAQHATAPLFWPDRQGPNKDSVVPEAEAAALPLEWDEASGRGIAWKTAYEGEGHCSPVIGGDLVWFTSATKDGKKMYVYAVNRHDGKVVHHKLVFENEEPEDLGNPLNNYAAPSCVLEEDAVYVHFGTYGTARLNPQTAEKVWERRDINVRHFRGPGSSPALYGDLLILTFDGIDKHFVTALNKNTGETVWLTHRSTDYGDLDAEGRPKMDGDLRKAYGTPTIVRVGDVDQLLSVGSKAAYGYEVLTGKEIWTFTHQEFNASARPIVVDGVAYVNTGSGRAHLMAVKLDETTRGDVTATHVLWDRDRKNSDLATPLAVNGYLFQVSGSGVGMCIDLKTGEDVWSERVSPGKFIAGPLATKERLYFFSDAGFATVLAAGPEFRLLAQNKFNEAITASPAVAEGAMFVRTKTHLCKIVK
jgi:outer membrane protein assembly factor BamB